MTRDEMIDVIALAERKAYREWWDGGRTPIDDRDRQDEMHRHRRAMILDAIEPALLAAGFLDGVRTTASQADKRANAVERSPMADSPWAKAVVPAFRTFARDMRESADVAAAVPLTPAAPQGD